MVGLGARVVGFGGRESGAGIVDGQAIVGRIELGDQVAGFDDGADVDGTDDDLAGDPEAQLVSMRGTTVPARTRDWLRR